MNQEIIRVTFRDGRVAVCDQACYNNKGHRTGCPCHGLNLGSGLAKAKHNVLTFGQEIRNKIYQTFDQVASVEYPIIKCSSYRTPAASSASTQPATSARSPSTPAGAQEPSGS